MELQMCQDFWYTLHFRSFQFCSSEAKWCKKLSHFNDFCHYFFAKIFFENSFTIPFVCSTFLSGVFTSNIFRLQHEVFIYCTGPKLGNAGPPQNHLSGPPKILFLDGDAKERAPKGRCQAWGVWGHAPQKILRNLTLFWRLFVRFEPLKFLSFNEV